MTNPLPDGARPLPRSLAQLTGASIDSIDTPALVVDLDAMERNLARMADFARSHGMRWRPHAKMHKSAELALMQVRAGAVGVCVQKTAEAEAMVAGGVRDVYISNEVVSLFKLQRVAHMALALEAEKGKISIAVDSLEGVQRLAAAMQALNGPAQVDVFVEIDVGHGRCGVPPGPAALVLAQEIVRHTRLRFAGLQAYQGRAQHLRTLAERRSAIAVAAQAVRATRECLEAAGLSVDLVSGAGTGSFALETASGVYGELQTGSFLFMDADYAANQIDAEAEAQTPRFEHALFVKSQVISTHAGHVVCDAGHNSHAVDSGLPKVVVPGDAGATALDYSSGGDEHGILRARSPQLPLPQLGDTVWLIPGHCDPTVNLHDFMIGVRPASGGAPMATGAAGQGLTHATVERIIRIDARGALT
jgi:D-serine deaminase-like pyridoxal phosphate-dependent protein